MASVLSREIGSNSVKFRTVNKVGYIDLRGKSHFDKSMRTYVKTPHVQSCDIKVENGYVTYPRKTEVVRNATEADIRIARRLADQQRQRTRQQENLSDRSTNKRSPSP